MNESADLGWILEGLLEQVPQIRHVVLLSGDGLVLAHCGPDREVPDREAAEKLSAIASGLQSLAGGIAELMPHSDKKLEMVVVENGGSYCYLMRAGERAYLCVTADRGHDAGLMARCMQELVDRLGHHMTTPARIS